MPDMGNIRIKDENMNKTTIITNVQTRLFELQDLKYRDFHAKLMPTVNKEKIIGVRTPALRVFAKKYGKTDEAKEYLQILPHQYYEENNLHGLLIEKTMTHVWKNWNVFFRILITGRPAICLRSR